MSNIYKYSQCIQNIHSVCASLNHRWTLIGHLRSQHSTTYGVSWVGHWHSLLRTVTYQNFIQRGASWLVCSQQCFLPGQLIQWRQVQCLHNIHWVIFFIFMFYPCVLFSSTVVRIPWQPFNHHKGKAPVLFVFIYVFWFENCLQVSNALRSNLLCCPVLYCVVAG